MKLKFMRKIDYWAGIPACAFLTLWSKLIKALRIPSRPAADFPKKFLFIKLSEMGAVIVAHPLLKNIQRQHPDAEFYFLTFDSSKHVIPLMKPLVPEHNVLTIRDSSFLPFLIDTFRTLGTLRKLKIDIALDLEFFSRFSALLTYLTSAPKRVGFYKYKLEGLYRGNLLTHKVPYNPMIHTSKSYLALGLALKDDQKSSPDLHGLGEETDFIVPQIPSDLKTRLSLLNILEPLGFKEHHHLFLLNAGEGTIPLREWPIENFVMLAEKILKDKKTFIAVVGMPSEDKKDQLITAAIGHGRFVNLTGKTSLNQLLELCHMSQGLIMNDCGIAHLASLTPIKKFILFGPESPQVFGSLSENTWHIYSGLYCSPCLSVLNHRNSTCKDNQCLKTISADYVFELMTRHCDIETPHSHSELKNLDHINK